MGSFGMGNFENDAALDARQDVINHITSAIQEWLGGDSFYVEDVDSVMGYVATLVAILENTRATPTAGDDSELLVFLKGMAGSGGPPKEEVSAWQEKIISTYDDEIDDLEPDEEYKVVRRQVIVDTFGRLAVFGSD